MICSQNIERPKSKYRLVMTKTGLVAYEKETPLTFRFDHKETAEILKRHIDFSKYDYHCEVAHLEISNNCNMNCSYCYVSNKDGKELTTKQWKTIIKNLADSGVFQVSFGGGEPTLRKDLFDLAKYVRDVGMNLGMTTNGLELIHLNPNKLRKFFKQINISWHEDASIVERALNFLSKNRIPCGINYCYSKQMARDNDVVKVLAEEYNAELLYLVYKPVIKDKKNQVPGEEVYKVAKQAANDGLKVAVDGPCVNECMMKKKFIDVDHFGNVYPCSFVRESIGNLLNMPFKEIWKNRGEQDECPYVKLVRKEE